MSGHACTRSVQAKVNAVTQVLIRGTYAESRTWERSKTLADRASMSTSQNTTSDKPYLARWQVVVATLVGVVAITYYIIQSRSTLTKSAAALEGSRLRTPAGVKEIAAIWRAGYRGAATVWGTRHSFAAAAALAMFGLLHP